MLWWQWDDEARCWRPTLVRPAVSLHLNGHARLVPLSDARRWALLASDGATVNGVPCLPLEVLDDRDEVSIAGARYVFSAHAPAEVAAFASEGKTIRCARCLGLLVDGDQVVRCPACRAHHHASCWSSGARCQKCPLLTDGALWVPGPLN